MRKIICFITIFLTFSGLFAQVESKRSNKAYSERESAQQKTIVQLKNEYQNKRQSFYSSRSKFISTSEQKQLNAIIASIEANSIKAYEYCFVQMVNTNYGNNFAQWLNAALKERKTKEISPYVVAHALMDGNDAKAMKWLKTINSNGSVDAAAKEYAKNLLRSVEQNAVLFTYGFADTYPLLIHQQLYNFRNDVTVVNMEWLQNDTYQKRIKNKLSINYNGNVIGDEKQWMRATSNSSKNYPVYYASSVPAVNLKDLSGQLYNTGLAFRLNPQGKFENIKKIEQNWQSFDKKQMFEKSGRYNSLKSNYLFGLLQLYKHYKHTNTDQSEKYKKNLEKIAAVTGHLGRLKQMFSSDTSY